MPNMKVRAAVLFLVSALAVILPIAAPAGTAARYSPPGLYDVEQFRPPNGLRVLLKQRPEAHSVSLRLVVRIGTRNFDCDHRETPHVLEHLLFSGTSKHGESDLDRMISQHGGTWNAATGQEYTTYQVDMFDQYTDLAIDLLYEIMTDTVFSAEKISKAEDIVAREIGGRPSEIRRVLYRYGIGKTAWEKANEWLLPGAGALCRGLPTLAHLTDDGILRTFRSSYTPENMTLIIVGNFNRRDVIGRIRRTFGTLKSAQTRPRQIVTPAYPNDGPVEVKGTLAPFLGSSGYVGVAFRTSGSDSPDAPALAVLGAYLDTRLYDRLRIKSGLSYNPEASAFLRPDYGILYLTADTTLANIRRVKDLIDQVLTQTVGSPPGAEAIEQTKQKILLQWVQNYETNAEISAFYADSVRDLDRLGRFRNYERDIEGVTVDDVARVIKTALRKDRRAEIVGIPTFSYTRFFILLGAAAGVLILAVLVWMRRAWNRQRKIPWYRR